METNVTTGNKRLTIWRQRIGYGAADFACNLIWQMISLYLLYFYTDVMSLDAASIGFMFVITRVIDGGTDLLIGYCIDRTNTRWGKSRPYLLFGAIPFALFAILTFSVPDISMKGKLIYAYVTYIGLSFSYTIVNIPLSSILPSLTDDAQERTALSTSRKFFGFLGATVVSASALKLVDHFGQGNQALGFRIVMIIFGVIGCLVFFFTFANVRERKLATAPKTSLKETFYSLRHNKPWQIFALNIVFMWSCYFFQTAAIVYYFTVVIGSQELSITVATIMTLVPMMANFLVPFLAKQLGKRNLFIAASVVQLAGMVFVFLSGSNVMGIIVSVIISALGYGIKESIYFSMQADPVDYGEWKTGFNTTGSQSAINGFIGKVCQAVAGGVSGMLLSWGHYQGGAATQPENAMLAIKIMYLGIPAILTVLSIVTMCFYNLDKLYPQIKEELAERSIEAAKGEANES